MENKEPELLSHSKKTKEGRSWLEELIHKFTSKTQG